MTLGKPVAGICAATALFVCGAAGFPTPPSSVPPATATLSLGGVSTTSLVAGQELELSASGFRPEAAITVAQYSEPTQLGTAVADAEGDLATTVTLDADLTGSHTIVAMGLAPDGSGMAVKSEVTIAPRTAAPSGASELAWTGVQTLPWVIGSILALLSGGALIRAAQGRRTLPIA